MAIIVRKPTIRLEDGTIATCQEPVIVSASRRTDIPAFYCDWFFYRLKTGYSAWVNPFNGAKMYISYAKTRFIVFWSKNPRPLIGYIDELNKRQIGCYIQYTLNDYEEEGLELRVPPLTQRIETFKLLVEKLGKGSVIWRFDPLMLTDDINIDKLLLKIARIGDQLKGYTEKLVFSFADIANYRKVESNLKANNIPFHEWTEDQMKDFSEQLVLLNKQRGWNFNLATCGEKGDYLGVEHNHCVDDELIIRRGYLDDELMDFLKVKIHPLPTQDLFGMPTYLPSGSIVLNSSLYATRGDNRDRGQRKYCGCMKSKDIGQYNTCIHMCEYCYANANKQVALRNWEKHQLNKKKETIF